MSDVVATERLGDFRTPRNAFQEAPGSIHNDAVASKLGFKGGTVPGSVHMDQFVPMLLDLYGQDWFRTGNLSLYFTQATVDAEEVRAVVQGGRDRARLTMFNRADQQICEGTASAASPDADSELAKRRLKQPPAQPGALRILADIAVGDEEQGIPLRVEVEALDKALKTLTEPLAAYGTDHILPPSHMVKLAHITRPVVLRKVRQSVGLFGALEVRQYAGPLKAGVDYLGRTKILALGESPRAEAAWYDVVISDPATGEDVGCVQFMLRFMKASSPLWTKDAAV